jgi:uncharacterized protein (DUF488 family)
MTRVYTIGHSNKPVEDLIERLARHGVVVVVDVRSKPYSSYNPQFNRDDVCESLRQTGRPYVFSGHSLGGMPDDPDLRTRDGKADYDKIRETPSYRKELAGLLRGVGLGLGPMALMCSEADPTMCHRRRLVGADLAEAGVEVVHILGDGSLQTEDEVRERLGENQPSVLDLFGA